MREELKILNSKSHIGVLNSNKKKNGLTLIDNRLGTISQRKIINTIHKCPQGKSFFPIQKNNTSTPASYLLERNSPLVIQRDYLETPAHDKDGKQAGWWSIEDDLSVNIEHNGLSKWIPPHSLFSEKYVRN